MIEIVIAISVGIVIGIYVCSQIKEHICANINQKELMKNMEEYDKKQTKYK
tara:strand:+ start:75 stop:227 length:153 start_codon:yes stop_codon:yes gene_type:complete